MMMMMMIRAVVSLTFRNGSCNATVCGTRTTSCSLPVPYTVRFVLLNNTLPQYKWLASPSSFFQAWDWHWPSARQWRSWLPIHRMSLYSARLANVTAAVSIEWEAAGTDFVAMVNSFRLDGRFLIYEDSGNHSLLTVKIDLDSNLWQSKTINYNRDRRLPWGYGQ